MSWMLIAHTGFAVGLAGGTTPPIDTTGADLIILGISAYKPNYDSGFGSITIGDNKGNSFARAAHDPDPSNLETDVRFVQAPTVGAGHTFTVSSAIVGFYPVFEVLAFSGSDADPVDQANWAETDGVTTIQPGSVTPSTSGQLLVVVGATLASATVPTVDSGFTVSDGAPYDGGNTVCGVAAYLFQDA